MPASPDVPILAAYATPDGLWAAWCSRCARWHRHSPQPGQRVAHCVGPDGYRDYELVGGEPADAMVLEAVQRGEAPP